jgi:alpha-N-arabinofuranosidase
LTLARSGTAASATITIDASTRTGQVSPLLFGQNLEHEHGAINGNEQNLHNAHGMHTGGLWAEMLRDRKFEQGAPNGDGVSNAWVPLERTSNRYHMLFAPGALGHRYLIDNNEYYGGGASQAMVLDGKGEQHAAVEQVALHFEKGKTYSFYVYAKALGAVSAYVEFGDVWPKSYSTVTLAPLGKGWKKLAASFVAPETTDQGRLEIGVRGRGTLWIDSASLMLADNVEGLRADVVEALKGVRVPALRYPGGCFADGYQWRDGVGDRDKRPERWSIFWHEWEPNDFGTDEVMQLAGLLGAELNITANYITGSPEAAAQWVQYANGAATTPMGRLRAQAGHAQPYGIGLWTIGNESQEQCSMEYAPHAAIEDYAARFSAYRAKMLAEDPTLRVFAGGAGPGPIQWNHDLLERITGLHGFGFSIYTGPGWSIPEDMGTQIMDQTQFYRQVVAEPVAFDSQLRAVIDGVSDSVRPDRFISVFEYQSWWLAEKVDADYRLADALYLGGVYNSLLRHASKVDMAYMESLANVQGLIEIGKSAVKLTPEYFASKVYQEHLGQFVVHSETSSQATEFNAQLPALDAVTTISADGQTLYLAVVNRAEASLVSTQIQITGWDATGGTAIAFELNGASISATNGFGSSDGVNIVTRPVPVVASTMDYSFPAHSLTVLQISRP